MTLVPIKKSHAETLARLHIQGIQTGFLSSLGLHFVTELYKAIAESKSSFGFIEQDNEIIRGFVVFTSNLNSLYKTIFLKNSHRLLFPLLAKMISFKTAQKIYETLFYPNKAKKLDLPEAELISIVVKGRYQGRGIARNLIKEVFKECANRKILKAKVLVAVENKAANALYLTNGFQLSSQIKSHGVLSNIFVFELDKHDNFMNRLTPSKAKLKKNLYFHALNMQDKNVFSIDGIAWFEYNHFIIPAYFPHCLPAISHANAEKALRYSGAFFARWETGYGKSSLGEWWHVIREESWSIQECSANTRSKIRRGRKKIHAAIVSPEFIESEGYALCKKACKRYGTNQFLPKFATFQKKVLCARTYPDNFHFFGTFFGNKLVAFSENYVQENAVLWESIWYDPEYLRYYSSYVLIDEMLNHYLNKLKMLYVSDGSRSIYHKTNVQDFLINKFGFMKKYAMLHIRYSPKFKYGLRAIHCLDFLIPPIKSLTSPHLLYRIEALLLQEKIRGSYHN